MGLQHVLFAVFAEKKKTIKCFLESYQVIYTSIFLRKCLKCQQLRYMFKLQLCAISRLLSMRSEDHFSYELQSYWHFILLIISHFLAGLSLIMKTYGGENLELEWCEYNIYRHKQIMRLLSSRNYYKTTTILQHP